MTDFNTVEELDRHVPMKPKSSRDVLIVGPHHIATLKAEVKKLRKVIRQAEQNIRNMGNGDLTGINQQRALNEARKLRVALEKGEKDDI